MLCFLRLSRMTVRNLFFCSDVIVCSEARDQYMRETLSNHSYLITRTRRVNLELTIHVSNFGVLKSFSKLGPSLM
jgi:hypothetical protein